MSRKKKVPRWKKVLRIRKTMATLILIGAVAAVAIAVANSRRTPIAREDTQMTPQDVADLLPPEEEEELPFTSMVRVPVTYRVLE